MPGNISLLPLPPDAPDPGSPLLSQGQAPGQALNPVENLWACLRANQRANSVFDTHDDIVDTCCKA